MNFILEHEFVENEHGELALVLNVVPAKEATDPVFMVSRDENKAYLHRGPYDIYSIIKINPAVIDRVRAAEEIMVVEMKEDKIARCYDAHAGIFEDNEDEDPD